MKFYGSADTDEWDEYLPFGSHIKLVQLGLSINPYDAWEDGDTLLYESKLR